MHERLEYKSPTLQQNESDSKAFIGALDLCKAKLLSSREKDSRNKLRQKSVFDGCFKKSTIVRKA